MVTCTPSDEVPRTPAPPATVSPTERRFSEILKGSGRKTTSPRSTTPSVAAPTDSCQAKTAAWVSVVKMPSTAPGS